jgi:deoxycytidine triphosphate deaminase
MSNNGNVDVELVAGESRVCQLMFLKISRKLTRSEMYGGSEDDIFAGQVTPVGRSNRKKV